MTRKKLGIIVNLAKPDTICGCYYTYMLKDFVCKKTKLNTVSLMSSDGHRPKIVEEY